MSRAVSLLACALAACRAGAAARDAPPQTPTFAFDPQTIAEVPGAYQVVAADVSGDGRLDLVVVAEVPALLAWFEAPAFRKHVISIAAERFIDVAPTDLDGDGRLDLVVASEFDVHDARRGRVHWLRQPSTADGDWTVLDVRSEPASHRIRFADLDGDGRRELVDAAFMGPGSRGPGDVPARLVRFAGPSREAELVSQTLHVVHGLRVVPWDGGVEALLTASLEGVTLHALGDGGWRHERLLAGGTGEVALGRHQARRFLATIEPAHGTTLSVAYEDRGVWRKVALDASLREGHALGVGDFDGDGLDEVVAGGKGSPGLWLWRASRAGGDAWHRHTVDARAMAPAGLVAVDLDGDGALDIVAAGQRTNNVIWYRNVRRR